MKKQAELQRILAPLGINVLTADMAGILLSEVDETGETFEEKSKYSKRCYRVALPGFDKPHTGCS